MKSDETAAAGTHSAQDNMRDSLRDSIGQRAHIVPLPLLVAVFGALIVLTVLTVAVTYVDLGAGNLWIAMIIAAVKATLVALYFMHLRYDRLLHGFIFLTGVLFVFLFVAIVLMDTLSYRPELIPWYAPVIDQ